MPSPIATYDPVSMQVIIAAIPASGFADGSFVNVAQDGESFTKRVGADGEVARARMADRSGTMTLTLLGTSTTNAALQALATSEEVFPVTIKDGANIVFGAQCWIVQPPVVDRGTEVPTHEWSIAIAKINFALAGNPA